MQWRQLEIPKEWKLFALNDSTSSADPLIRTPLALALTPSLSPKRESIRPLASKPGWQLRRKPTSVMAPRPRPAALRYADECRLELRDAGPTSDDLSGKAILEDEAVG
jgi:hypothetical protein